MKEDKKVSWEDIAWSNMYSIEALMNILENKGLITKQEVLGELQKLKVEHHKDVNQMFVSIAIDWRKKMMDNRMFKKKTIREFILLLSTAFFIHIKDRSQFQSHPIQW